MGLKTKAAIAALMLCGAMIGCGPSATVTVSHANSVTTPEDIAAYRKAHWPNEPDQRWYGEGDFYPGDGLGHHQRRGGNQHPCRFNQGFLDNQPATDTCHVTLVQDDFLSYEREHVISDPSYTTNVHDGGDTSYAAAWVGRRATELTALTCEIKGKGVYVARVYAADGDFRDQDVVCK